MPEDKLTRPERIRLESLSQAINATVTLGPARSPEELFRRAETIESWLKSAPLENLQ